MNLQREGTKNLLFVSPNFSSRIKVIQKQHFLSCKTIIINTVSVPSHAPTSFPGSSHHDVAEEKRPWERGWSHAYL